MLILDVSNPDSPQLLGQYATTAQAKDVQVVGSLAYIGDLERQALSMVDISNPSQPTLVYELPLIFRVWRIEIVGQRAYLSTGVSMQIVDLSDPPHPVARGSIEAQHFITDLAVAGSLAYTADTNGSFSLIDVTNPDQPVLVDTYKNWYRVEAVEITNNLARIAADGRMLTLDVGDPEDVQQVGSYGSKAYTVVDAAGERLYAISADGFEILDVHDPAQPLVLGTYPGRIFFAVVVNEIGYLTISGGFDIVDLRDPTQPRKLGGYTGEARIAQVADAIGYAIELRMVGEHRYESDLLLFDLRDPASPRLLGKTSFGDEIFDLWVVGPQVYLATRLGLVIVDVHDPAHPVQQGRALNGTSTNVQVASGRTWLIRLTVFRSSMCVIHCGRRKSARTGKRRAGCWMPGALR